MEEEYTGNETDQPEEEQENPVLKLSKEMERMADVMEELTKNKFNRELLAIYIHDRTKLGKQKINMVLDAMDSFIKEMKG